MRKRLAKVAALATCLAVLLTYVPMSYAGSNTYLGPRTINFAAEILYSIFFFLPSANSIGYTIGLEKNSGNTSSNVRITGEIPINRTGGGD